MPVQICTGSYIDVIRDNNNINDLSVFDSNIDIVDEDLLMPALKISNLNQDPIFTLKQIKHVFEQNRKGLSDPEQMIENILSGLNATADEHLCDIYENAVVLFERHRCPVARKMLKYFESLDRSAEHIARDARFAEAVRQRDTRCLITKFGGKRCQAAHILDFAVCETQFEKYDPNNGILLDASMHICWDNQRAIAVPNPERMSVIFRAHPALSKQEVEEEIPELLEPKEIAVLNKQQMDYFIRRYDLDMGRG